VSEPERLAPEQLRTLFLFEHLTDDQLAWLSERGRVVEYSAGSTIHAEGAPASCFFLLLSGTIAMSSRVQGGEIELFRTDYYGATQARSTPTSPTSACRRCTRARRARSRTAGCSNCPPQTGAVP
jgi:CRP-like cAMP-binding protein